MYGKAKRTLRRGSSKPAALAAHGAGTGVVRTKFTPLVVDVLHQLELLPALCRKALPFA